MSNEGGGKKDGWEVVSETKTDGSCNAPNDSKDEPPQLSSDDDNASCNSTGAPPKEERKKALSVRYRLPTESHGTSSPIQLNGSPTSSPVESARSSPHVSPGLGPRSARPRLVEDLLNISTLSEFFPNSSYQKIEQGILDGNKHCDNAYLNGGIKVSTALNEAEFYQETKTRTGQKTSHTQHAPCAEYRQAEDPEVTAISLDLSNSEDEYIY